MERAVDIEHSTSNRSILDLLKEDYQELKDIKDVTIPIIGWEKTGLAIKYRLPESGAELDTLARKVFQEVNKKDRYGRNFKIAMDTMIHLNEGLYVKPRGIEDYIELDPSETGSPMVLADGEELSVIFGWDGEVRTARDVVRKLFNNNDLAIINHAEKLNRWLVDTKVDLNVELWELGEAQ